jgi:sec-independent protein translocase protein TatA
MRRAFQRCLLRSGAERSLPGKGARVPNLGLSELIVILMILLLVFGASRLPALGESVGRTIRGFKRGMSTDEQITVKQQAGASEPSAAAPGKQKPASQDVDEAEIVEPKKG